MSRSRSKTIEKAAIDRRTPFEVLGDISFCAMRARRANLGRLLEQVMASAADAARLDAAERELQLSRAALDEEKAARATLEERSMAQAKQINDLCEQIVTSAARFDEVAGELVETRAALTEETKAREEAEAKNCQMVSVAPAPAYFGQELVNPTPAPVAEANAGASRSEDAQAPSTEEGSAPTAGIPTFSSAERDAFDRLAEIEGFANRADWIRRAAFRRRYRRGSSHRSATHRGWRPRSPETAAAWLLDDGPSWRVHSGSQLWPHNLRPQSTSQQPAHHHHRGRQPIGPARVRGRLHSGQLHGCAGRPHGSAAKTASRWPAQ